MPDIRIVDPAALPGAPDPLPKGWDAADWDVPGECDATEAILSAAVAPAPPVVELVAIDPTYPAEIILPRAIIAVVPGDGTPLPAGDIGLLAGAGGERKSTLTLHMAIAAAAADDGALVSPFTGLPAMVEEGDPFTTGESQIAVCGGPVAMASWEDAAPWLAKRSRAIAKALDERSGSKRHTRILTDSKRLASVQLGYGEPLFGVPAGQDTRAMPTPQAWMAAPLGRCARHWREPDRGRPDQSWLRHGRDMVRPRLVCCSGPSRNNCKRSPTMAPV